MREALILILSCAACLGQFAAQQPFFQSAASVPFSPDSITGLKMWLSATNLLDETLAPPASNGKVYIWNDQSGLGNNATNGQYPTYNGGKFKTSGGPNGSNYVAFNGGTFDIGAYTNALNIAITNNISAVYVLRTLDRGFTDYGLLLNEGLPNPSEGNGYLHSKNNGTTFKMGTTAGPATIDSTKWYVVIETINGVNASLYTNAVLYSTATLSSTPFWRGCTVFGVVSGACFNGDCVEMLLYYGVLSSQNISDLTTYYKNKYGL